MPSQVTHGFGSFTVRSADYYIDPTIDPHTVNLLERFMASVSALNGELMNRLDAPTPGCIEFQSDRTLPVEAYTLDVTPEGVNIGSNSYNGFLYATITFFQMLPANIQADGPVKGQKAVLPVVSIKDQPRFSYRGMHLDCARHMFSTDEVKKYLMLMANYKLNVLHWHLTDDQGWRFESKKYPRLNEISAYRDGTMVGNDFNSCDSIRYGGYYTQEEMKEIVVYASLLGITIIPEIDLPGHMVAALAAYPELGCTGGPYKVWTRWGISDDVLCPGKEETFTFIEDILDEVCSVFPGGYIHIGGDECPTTRWQHCPDCQRRIRELHLHSVPGRTKEQYLQNYVTNRVQMYLASKGRRMIGWDEVLEGGVLPGATIMSWRGTEGGIKAANMGFNAIMTPTSYLYFDYYQSDQKDLEPLSIGGYQPIEKVYSYDALEGVPADAQDHILGVQANLWTEYIATDRHLEYMLLPRLAALSEIQWCSPDNKDFDRFRRSMDRHRQYYDAIGVAYHKGLWGEYGLTEE